MIIYTDDTETISKLAFTRRCNRLDKYGTLYEVAVIEYGDTTYYNITYLE